MQGGKNDYFGPSLSIGNASLALIYTMYASPSDAFTTVEEVSLSFSWDDSESGLLLGVPLAPSATVAWKIDGDVADGQKSGVYLELSVEPGFGVEEGTFEGVSISVVNECRGPQRLGQAVQDAGVSLLAAAGRPK